MQQRLFGVEPAREAHELPSLSGRMFDLSKLNFDFDMSHPLLVYERNGVMVHLVPSRVRAGESVVLKTTVPKSSTGFLRPKLFLDSKYLNKVQYEARLLLGVHSGDSVGIINVYSDAFSAGSDPERPGAAKKIVLSQPSLSSDYKSLYQILSESPKFRLTDNIVKEIARSCLSKYQKLHQVYRLCHGDVHAGNIMVSNVTSEALVTATGEKPSCARNLFPRPKDETPLGVVQVELIDYDFAFPFESVGRNPYNSNGFTGKAGAMLLHDEITEACRYTALDDLGSLAITLLMCALGYEALSGLSKEAKAQLHGALRDNNPFTYRTAAQTITSRMDKFVKILLDEDTYSGGDKIFEALVPRVPEFLRQYMRVVRKMKNANQNNTQAQIVKQLGDYKIFSAVFA